VLAQPLILSLTGDKASADAGKLGKLGTVTWVPVDKLFGF
jgi:hypothetical protein